MTSRDLKKVKVVTQISLVPNISKRAEDRGLVILNTNRKWGIAMDAADGYLLSSIACYGTKLVMPLLPHFCISLIRGYF